MSGHRRIAASSALRAARQWGVSPDHVLGLPEGTVDTARAEDLATVQEGVLLGLQCTVLLDELARSAGPTSLLVVLQRALDRAGSLDSVAPTRREDLVGLAALLEEVRTSWRGS